MEFDGRIFRMRDAEWLERGNGVRSWPLTNEATGARRLLTGITEVPSGVAIPLHTHSSEEFVMVLEGSALVRIQEREERVEAMDATFIPEGVLHQFVNVGQGPLRITWIYSDLSTTRTLAATGLTLGQLEPYPDASRTEDGRGR